MRRKNLERVSKDIRAQQSREQRKLKGAIVGRPLKTPQESTINVRLVPRIADNIHYRRAGQIALVYLFRHELREYRGKTFYNLAHVDQAIQKAPNTVKEEILINRGRLGLVEPAYHVAQGGLRQYWLTARAVSSERSNNNQPVDMKREELALANHLFMEDNDITGQPHLWLGAISSPNTDAALESLNLLEDIISPQLYAEPVRLVRWRQ